MKHCTAVLVLAAFLGGCSSSASDSPLKARLPRLSGESGASLADCPTPRCLTVYVAPWCHYCRAATPLLIELRAYLQAR